MKKKEIFYNEAEGKIINPGFEREDSYCVKKHEKVLRCSNCGSELKLSIGYTGCDWNTEAGEGSDYNYEVSLDCTNQECASIYTIGHIKNINDFTPVIDRLKCVKNR